MAFINIISTMQNDCIYRGKNEEEVLLKGKGFMGILTQNTVNEEHVPFLKNDECFLRAFQLGLYRIEAKELTNTEVKGLDLSGFQDPSRRIEGVEASDGTLGLSKNEQPKAVPLKSIKKPKSNSVVTESE